MKLVAAADHGGFQLKNELVKRLREHGHEVVDLGADSEEIVDYPKFALKAANMIADRSSERGVLVCGTGIGMSIMANKVNGVYCAKINTPEEGALASAHNHANMVSLGGRTMTPEAAWAAVKAWLDTPRETGRHERRVQMITKFESAQAFKL